MTDSRLLVYTSMQKIRWGDMDAFDHVNNTIYFRYMEQARLGTGRSAPLPDAIAALLRVEDEQKR